MSAFKDDLIRTTETRIDNLRRKCEELEFNLLVAQEDEKEARDLLYLLKNGRAKGGRPRKSVERVNGTT